MLAILDVCSGNLRSVERALAHAGGDVVVTRDPHVVRRADKIVVPGQGAFGVFMRGLGERGLGEALRERIADGTPCALLLRAMSKDKPTTKREVVVTLIVVALYAASDEFHQRFTPGRSSEGISVLFDVAGGAIGVWVWQRWARRAQPQEMTD